MSSFRVLVVERKGGQGATHLSAELADCNCADHKFEIVGVTISEAWQIGGDKEFAVIVVDQVGKGVLKNVLALIRQLAERFPSAVMLAHCVNAECAGQFISAGCTCWVTHVLELPTVVRFYAEKSVIA